jgi:hypothetical protein
MNNVQKEYNKKIKVLKPAHTIKYLVTLMEEYGENSHFINGWLMSLIDQTASDKSYSIQQGIDNGIEYYKQKILLKDDMKKIQRTANMAKLEELYA